MQLFESPNKEIWTFLDETKHGHSISSSMVRKSRRYHSLTCGLEVFVRGKVGNLYLVVITLRPAHTGLEMSNIA